MAVDTGFQAAAAVVGVAALARVRAVVTQGVGTAVAISAAVTAQVAVATLARPAVIVRGRVAAGRAGHAVPRVEPLVGGVRVVGLQDLPHDDEELADPALVESAGQRATAIAFAERGA